MTQGGKLNKKHEPIQYAAYKSPTLGQQTHID